MPAGDIPSCEHGPGLLFERFFSDKVPQRFFACSACRDQADCPLFVLEDEAAAYVAAGEYSPCDHDVSWRTPTCMFSFYSIVSQSTI